jgi:hypothetical protein
MDSHCHLQASEHRSIRGLIILAVDIKSDVKTLIGVSDTFNDAQLQVAINLATSRVTSYVGTETLPDSLAWIVEELAISRFNRIGNEGMSQNQEEGRVMMFTSDDLTLYRTYLDKYIADNDTSGINEARVKFL